MEVVRLLMDRRKRAAVVIATTTLADVISAHFLARM